jgi:NADH dehydrogenase (ubiquinone) Fe-S protein 8
MSRSIRHLRALALAPSLRATPTVLSLARPIRSFHSSPFRLLATPQTGPQTVSSGPIATPNPTNTSNASAETSGSIGVKAGGGQGQGSVAGATAKAEYPDYSKGESALDKAAQLFFFTEILRGELSYRIQLVRGVFVKRAQQ